MFDSPVKRFALYAPIHKSVQQDDGDWIIEGPLSDPGEDLQGDKMSMDGLRKGLQVYERLGKNLDWEHLYRATKDPKYLIGKGLSIYDAPHPKTGANVPWLRAKLFKGKAYAKHAIEHLNEGGTLGYSVEGGAIRKGNGLMQTVIAMVTVTPQPVVADNAGTVSRVLKSLTALREHPDSWEQVELVPELVGMTANDHMFSQALDEVVKSMEATGATPRSGPGANATEVEDLSGGVSKQESEADCPVCERPHKGGRCHHCETMKKALAYQLATELADFVRTC